MQFEIDINSEHKNLFNSVRRILLEKYALHETKKPRITTYSDSNSGICHMRTMEHGVDLGFLKGARMVDEHRVLCGTGKVMRVLSISDLNLDQIYYYLDQAIGINANKKMASSCI